MAKLSGKELGPVKLGALANTQQLLLAPCIDTLTLCRGWDESTTEALTNALSCVLRANPVLTGKLVSKSSGMFVEPVENFRVEDFLHKVQPPEGVTAADLEKLNLRSKRLAYIQEKLGHAFADLGTGNDQLSSRSNLFAVEIMLLGQGWACYSVSLSHLVGDGATVGWG